MKIRKSIYKIVLVTVLLFGVVSISFGCGISGTSNPTPKPTQTQSVPTVTPQPTQPTEHPNEPPNNVTWISPGKVEVGNFYAGATAEWPITVHNGNDEETKFLIKYRYPDHVGDGYSYPTSDVENWITIGSDSIMFGPYETKEIIVALNMPEGASSPGDKWEFWISVIDASQEGFVKTELCIRWLIVME